MASKKTASGVPGTESHQDKAGVIRSAPKREIKKPPSKTGRKVGRPKGKKNRTASQIEADKNRKAGVLKHKATLAAKDRMAASEALDELGFDPLKFAVDVAMGKELKINHPFLKVINGRVKQWQQRAEKGMAFDPAEFEEFMAMAVKSLGDSWTPIDLRNRNALELIKYIHPQLKSQDINMGGAMGIAVVTPLCREEIELFDKWFGENY